MRIRVRLPTVEPEVYGYPMECPYERCAGHFFKRHGLRGEEKAVRDLNYDQVTSFRCRCLRCGRTFRVYPQGISRAQQSDRLKAITVLLYALGLSYGAVADFLTALAMAVCKTTVYNNVQEAGIASRSRQQAAVARGGKKAVIGSDGTYVKVKGEKVGIQVVVDDQTGDLLGLDIVVSENSEEVRKIVEQVAEQVEAEVLVSDDLDVYKNVADELGLDHQICRGHVKRNVDELAKSLVEQLKKKEPLPEGVDSSTDRLQEDVQTLQQLVRARPPDALDSLEKMYYRYMAAPVPTAGERHTVWYRMRMLVLRLWERWARLTLDQRRDDLDGTNNSSERLIGWWIKERYRTMRGYKRTESIRNVVTLTARMGVRSDRYDMSELYA
jgi:transposase-like protein